MTLQELKAKAESMSVEPIEWFTSSTSPKVVGIDWFADDVYIIDPDSPDYPQIELAQFDGIEQLFNGKEN
jgi:hypothetical protein